MKNLIYNIHIRGESNRIYKTKDGLPIHNFQVTSKELTVGEIKKYCNVLYDSYKAIAKVGTTINIDVLVFNNISETYMCIFSLYDHLNKTEFIHH